MLYIASALPPSATLKSILVEGFTSPGSQSLIIAKPDRIEAWDVTEEGLTHRADLEIWGSVVTVEQVHVKGAEPHLLVLTSPPNAQLLLVAFSPTAHHLVVTSSIPLTPPTPTLRTAEFFSSMIVIENVALVSLWIGVLSCIDLEIEKDKDAKRRRSSAAVTNETNQSRKVGFRDNFNINIREHNLISLAFLPNPTPTGPLVNFVWLTSSNALLMQTRTLSIASHALTDISQTRDLVSPEGITADENSDFNQIPFSCPAARRVLPIPSESTSERTFLVMGDEFSVLYALSASPPARSRMSISSGSGVATSPRAAATRRSPQTEMVAPGKRRKSSITSKGDDKWELKPLWRVRQGFGTILAAGVIQSGSSGASVLLGDESGRLVAIGWEPEQNEVGSPGISNKTVNVRMLDLGKTSAATSLTHLSGSKIFLTSACGDTELLDLAIPTENTRPRSSSFSARTSPRAIPKKGKGKARTCDQGYNVELEEDTGRTEIMERWMNLAPIKDFCVVQEEGGGGVSHLVIASGAATTNSLRVVRSGVGLEEQINIEGISGVERIWSLTMGNSTNLLISTNRSTHAVQVHPEVTGWKLCSQIASRATLAAGVMLNCEMLITVTTSGVELWSDAKNGERIASWSTDQEVIAAQVHGNMIVLAKRGGEITIVTASGSQLEHTVSCNISIEVSSISIFNSSKIPSPIIAVATWSSEIILHTLESLATSTAAHTLSEKNYAASLHLKPSNNSLGSTSGIQLLAGLSDGSLVVYDLGFGDDAGGVLVLGRKLSSLGTRPLQVCPIDNWSHSEEKIVAIGLSERMSVVFETRDRIDLSSASERNVTAATAISLPSGDALILATPYGLSISSVNSLKKLHVQTMDLGEKSINRVSALPWSRHLAVGTITRSMDAQSGEVVQRGSFELRDATSLEVLAELDLLPREEVTCVNPVTLLAENYIAVGTAIFRTDADFDEASLEDDLKVNAKEGRLLLIKPEQNSPRGTWSLRIITLLKTIGPVFDSTVIHGFLAVAAASKVSINRLTRNPPVLAEVSSFSSAFIAQHLRVTSITKEHSEERLVTGDGMRSIFVLEVDEGSGTVFSDQRDMATHRVFSMEGVLDGGEGIIVADGHANLLTFRLKENIETAASFGLHEDIVRFRKGSLAPPNSAADVIRPDLLYATADGRLGIIGELGPSAARTMDDLQRNMDKYYKGTTDWKTWRQGGNEQIKRDTKGFIDGDFIQRYLDPEIIHPSEAEKILNGGSAPEKVSKLESDGSKVSAERNDVRRILEAAAGMH